MCLLHAKEKEALHHSLYIIHLKHRSGGNSEVHLVHTEIICAIIFIFYAPEIFGKRKIREREGDLTFASARCIYSLSVLGALGLDLMPSRSAENKRREKQMF